MLLKKRQKILTVRLVRFGVQGRGFFTQSVIVVTSLLDVKALPASGIAEHSARRWQVEQKLGAGRGLDPPSPNTPPAAGRSNCTSAISRPTSQSMSCAASRPA
jgi:hypothetical protein